MELMITKAFKSKTDGQILAYSWVSDVDKKRGTSPKKAFVEWIEKQGGRAYIKKDGERIYYAVRVLPDGERTIQPSREGSWIEDTTHLKSAILT